MLLMIEKGRLGNQIFQYCALRGSAGSSERVVLFGFTELREVFEGIDADFLPLNRPGLRHLHSMTSRDFRGIAKVVPGIGIVSEDEAGIPVKQTRGLLKLVEPSWFQALSPEAEAVAGRMRIRREHIKSAHDVAAGHGVDLNAAIVVHVRGGDYLQWPSSEHPAVLPATWYVRHVEQLCNALGTGDIAIVGDESALQEEVASRISGARVLPGTAATHFAMVASSRAAVVSASSFGFWSAWWAQRAGASGPFIAPEFWIGHRRGSWWPSGIKSSFLTYMPVLESDYEEGFR